MRRILRATWASMAQCRQCARPTALYRGWSKRPDDHCRDRIKQCLCASCGHRHCHLVAQDIGPAATSGLLCGNENPVGIIGTPVVDLASRSLFFNAMIQGNPLKHFIYSLNVDTGATNAGWPVDVTAPLPQFSPGFTKIEAPWLWSMASYTCLILDTSVIAAVIMAGWLACISTTRPRWPYGRRRRQGVVFGDIRGCQRWHQHVCDYREHDHKPRRSMEWR